jgi:hypothetical protein
LALLWGTSPDLTSVVEAGSNWPVVAPLNEVFRFSDARTAEVGLWLQGVDGSKLYRLECHPWLYEKDRDFNYSGDFECRLTSASPKESYSTLLTDNPKQSRDWESRGRFLVPELVGECGGYPQYGRVRTFRLRGMQLRLEIKEIKLRHSTDNATKGPLALESFTLSVAVHSDPNARSQIAEPAKVTAPPPACGAGYRSH